MISLGATCSGCVGTNLIQILTLLMIQIAQSRPIPTRKPEVRSFQKRAIDGSWHMVLTAFSGCTFPSK